MLDYIPYLKYVIAPGTRFERDKKVLFDPDGDVAQGRELQNYGWAPSGLKEFIEALYKARRGNLTDFNSFYERKILKSRRNIVEVLREEGLIDRELPALLIIRLREGVEVPALFVNVKKMFFKRCDECGQSWRNKAPPDDFTSLLEELKIESVVRVFQCSRQLCKLLCGYYSFCEKSYTSTEGVDAVERGKLDCLKALLMLLAGRIPEVREYNCILKEEIPCILDCRRLVAKKNVEKQPLTFEAFKSLVDRSQGINCTVCIERPLRFDMKPLRYFFFDDKTWKDMRAQRYCKTPGRRNIDALPAGLLSEFINVYGRYLDGTQLITPTNRRGVLETFLNVSEVKFELKHCLERICRICGQTHKITDIPIKAMFRDSEVFKHEAYFANLLWDKIWEVYPSQFCRTFGGRAQIKMSSSTVLKREVKSREVDPSSRFPLSSYDYVVDLSPLGVERRALFDLTTGLWKKSGFHEVGRTTEEYVEVWRELLFNIPKNNANMYAVWYAVVNSTEYRFFDETAPGGVKNMDDLVDLITSHSRQTVLIVRSEDDAERLDLNVHKLIVVPVFNTSPRRRDAHYEIDRLESGKYDRLLIWRVVSKLLAEGVNAAGLQVHSSRAEGVC